MTINARGRILELSEPGIMAILNLTTDSFFEGSRVNEKGLLERADAMLEEGASILDIGAVSTRPGARIPRQDEEEARLLPAFKLLREHLPEAILSVDSFRTGIQEKCLDMGSDMINDISAGNLDDGIFELAARYQVPYVLMHMQGRPETMQDNPSYDDVTAEVLRFFVGKLEKLRALGVHDVIVDPGFGFGKDVSHNYELLRKLAVFRMLECPVMVGISRKSLICKTLKINPVDALNGTTALHAVALLNGANILRVHDVKEARETINLLMAYTETGTS